MSEPSATPSPAVTPALTSVSEPVSLRSVVESTMSELPDSSEPHDDDAPMSEPSEPAPVITQAEIDELAVAFGLDGSDQKRWTRHIPYSKISKIVKEREGKHAEALKAHADRIAQFEQYTQQFDALLGDPDRMLEELAKIDPRYGKYRGSQPQPDAPPRLETAEDVQRLIDQRVAERVAPFEREAQSRRVMQAALPKVKAAMETAYTWPQFREHEAAIVEALKADQSLSLEGAYMKVVLPKLGADRSKVRQEVLAEVNGAPASTVTPSTVARTDDDGDPKSLRSLIWAEMRSRSTGAE